LSIMGTAEASHGWKPNIYIVFDQWPEFRLKAEQNAGMAGGFVGIAATHTAPRPTRNYAPPGPPRT
jgi:hypothetical protein